MELCKARSLCFVIITIFLTKMQLIESLHPSNYPHKIIASKLLENIKFHNSLINLDCSCRILFIDDILKGQSSLPFVDLATFASATEPFQLFNQRFSPESIYFSKFKSNCWNTIFIFTSELLTAKYFHTFFTQMGDSVHNSYMFISTNESLMT